MNRPWKGLVPVLPVLGLVLLPFGAAMAQQAYPVDIDITLSAKAAATLKQAKEGLKIFASFQGDPRPGAEKHAGEDGRIDLGHEEIEAPGDAGTVHLAGTQLKHERVHWVEGPLNMNVNIASARRSSEDNVLDCDFVDGDVAKLAGRRLALHCALIGEGYESRLIDR